MDGEFGWQLTPVGRSGFAFMVNLDTRQFTDDADFTVWFGLELKGREAIASGHQFVFDSVYPDTVFELDIRQLRFLGPDTAMVHLKGRLTKVGEPRSDAPDAVPMAVLKRVRDNWKVIAFHNTPFLVNELRGGLALGEMKRLLLEAIPQSQEAPRGEAKPHQER